MEGSKKECPRLKKTEKTGPDTMDPRSKGISSPWEALTASAETDLREALGSFEKPFHT